jgi:hypothetical protein
MDKRTNIKIINQQQHKIYNSRNIQFKQILISQMLCILTIATSVSGLNTHDSDTAPNSEVPKNHKFWGTYEKWQT